MSTSLGTVVAMRELVLKDKDGDQPVTVRIGMPQPFDDGHDYYCPFEINGIGETTVQRAGGVDAVQALQLAMTMIGITLYASEEAAAGQLRWLDEYGDLGFPVQEGAEDLLPFWVRAESRQLQICKKYDAFHYPAPPDSKVGISRNVKDGISPLNGLRHPPGSSMSGWYIWAGEEYSDDPDFFVPLHISHLGEWCPTVIPYLGLPPGWRFLLAEDYEDVWYDKSLLDV